MIRALLHLAQGSTNIYLTNHDSAITLSSNAYTANRVLRIQEINSAQGTPPSIQIEVICPEDEDVYDLLKTPSALIEATVYYLSSTDGNAWEEVSKFLGYLSSGQMERFLYKGVIEHAASYHFQHPNRRRWNHQDQQARDSTDTAFLDLPRIVEVRQSIDWRGYEEKT